MLAVAAVLGTDVGGGLIPVAIWIKFRFEHFWRFGLKYNDSI